MKATLLFSFSLLLASFVRSQVVNDSILVDGHYRVFHFNTPTGDQKGNSLVFVLHGSGGNGVGMMKSAAKLDAQSASQHFIAVYPDGYKRYWNECRKASTAAANQEDVNEQAFFSGMIEYFKKHYAINTKQVFAVGTSGGGHMAYKLALTMPNQFRAVTALIANLPDSSNMDCVEARVAVPVMIVNGTADKTNPYDGGEVVIPGIVMGTVRSTDATFRYWASLAGYNGEPAHTFLPDTDPNDGKTIERFTFLSKGKPEITLLKVNGGKHDYPNDIDVHLEAWEFFKRQF